MMKPEALTLLQSSLLRSSLAGGRVSVCPPDIGAPPASSASASNASPSTSAAEAPESAREAAEAEAAAAARLAQQFFENADDEDDM